MLLTAIKAHLDGSTNIQASIYFYIVPEGVKISARNTYIVLSRTNVERAVTYCGTNDLVQSSVAIDCYAGSYTSAYALAGFVRDSLLDYRGNLGGSIGVHATTLEMELDMLDSEPGMFRVSQSWDIWHGEE